MSDIVERLRSHDDCLLQPIRSDVKEAADEIERQRAEIDGLRAMLPPTAHSGVRSAPGEGSWSVFAQKVAEERDAARAENDRLRADNKRLKQEPELLRAELISLANAARNALADAYDRAKEGRP